jgi:proteasome lid subunit RPN8/RPN11
MTLDELIIKEIYPYAEAQAPLEACGLIIVVKGKLKFIACTNQLQSPDHFVLSPLDYANAEDQGEIVYVVHSHPRTLPNPSQTDLVSLEQDNVPWLIVNPFIKEYTITKPTGYKVPLLGRTYHHGVVDCYTLIRDYYKEKLNIELFNYPREDKWWLTGQDIYNEGFPKEGFQQVLDGTIQEHDILLMRLGSNTENHGAIYIGDNRIMHHPLGRISTEDIYGGWWHKITCKVIRHRSLL